ncbi:RING-H2 finger protein ATL2-like isoform X2 [Telopea speciosissima]|uniref:RING-H2 finger protein ATL2-like isoform X2 n=1 Tax=Telopea speciosissima TaxID=54955 RepID=UPI001CC5D65F|nr:RING-H2 finger protein ATL2-like isoform X2 [Telopea speciosissima]
MSFTKSNGSIGDPGSINYSSNNGYALSGKIMLSAIIILFTVVILFICLHIYARWYLLRARRRLRARRNRRRTTHIVFSYESSAGPANTAFVPSQGLEESVLKSLPTFVYSSATHNGGVLECAVCLSEFEEDEKGRLLPKCNHSFHIDCIDMWFQSHSTCPLCRTLVCSEIPARAETPVEVSVRVDEPESGPSYGFCPSCSHDRDDISSSSSTSSSSSSQPSSSSPSPADSSSLKTRRKTLEAVTISIEVPRRSESLRGLVEEEELYLGSAGGQGLKSPGGQQSLKSPGGRILSLKRILSRERKGTLSPNSPATGMSYSAGTEIDLESGERI